MLLGSQLDGRLHLDLALDDIHSGDRTIIRLAWQWNGSMAIILAHEDVRASAAAANTDVVRGFDGALDSALTSTRSLGEITK